MEVVADLTHHVAMQAVMPGQQERTPRGGEITEIPSTGAVHT